MNEITSVPDHSNNRLFSDWFTVQRCRVTLQSVETELLKADHIAGVLTRSSIFQPEQDCFQVIGESPYKLLNHSLSAHLYISHAILPIPLMITDNLGASLGYSLYQS